MGISREDRHGAVSVNVDTRGDESVVWLDNGLVRVGCTPALGGRMLSLSAAGREFLYRDDRLVGDDLHRAVPDSELPPLDGTMVTWRNFGGDKTWPAPQGWESPTQWPGPPDEVLDSGAYGYSMSSDATSSSVEMESAPDERTGLQVTRRVTLREGGMGLTLDLAFTNRAAEAVAWSIWNVTQVPGGASLYVGVDEPADTIDMFALTGALRREPAGPGVLHVPPQDEIGKIGIPSANGWLAYVRDGWSFGQVFEVDPGAVYPDGGSRVEVWTQAPLDREFPELGGWRCDAPVVECEVLGPLVELAPGETSSNRIEMRVARCTAAPTSAEEILAGEVA